MIAALLLQAAFAGADTLPPAPNIVLILTDDMGYTDIGCYGQTRYTTPHIDRLAREGVRFTDFYASQPICTASRASLLTGSYANRIGIHGAFGLSTRQSIHPDEITLGELCQQAGYATAIYGKWGLGHLPPFSPLRHGFDEFYGLLYSHDVWPHHPTKGALFPDLPMMEGETVAAYNVEPAQFTTDLTERTVDFIRRQHAASRPFFAFLSHPMPHVPLGVSPAYANKSGVGLYGDVIQEIDWSVGRILETLEELGITENTLVLFSSDNGPWLGYGDHGGCADPFREGKQTVFEGGVRVPFIAHWPGVLPAGRVVTAPAMNIDVFPTIAELLRLPPATAERPIDGRSLWPLLSGVSDEPVQDAYFFFFGRNQLQAMRSGPWKLIFPHTYRSFDGQPIGNGGLPGEFIRRDTELALYDLASDPGEARNVVADHPAVLARLNALAQHARNELGDALTGAIGTGNREPDHVLDP